MNVNKIFSKLKEKNIHEAEFHYNSNSSFSIEVFRGQLKNYTTNINDSITLNGIIDDKLIIANTENVSNKNIDLLIDDMLERAKYTTKKGAEIFKGATKYKKYNHYNKELEKVPTNKKIDLVFEIEKKLKNYDPRFKNIMVGYSELSVYSMYQNTNGVKLKNKRNGYSIDAYVILKDNEETKEDFISFVDNDFSKFNIDKFVSEIATKLLAKLHPIKIRSQKYNVIFDPEVTSTLLDCYISQLNAELILKNSSWFKDKINKEVANKKVSIFESPLKRDAFFSGYDSQGVPTSNRFLIKKGKLLTYLHNLETAKKFNVEPTGHAKLGGSKISIGPHAALYLKPGRLTKEQLIQKVANGFYITSLEGLHAGMNPQNGNFSLKAEGFIIKDGRIEKPVDMITVNSNLFTIFQKVQNISTNIEYMHKGYIAPCIYLKNIAISC